MPLPDRHLDLGYGDVPRNPYGRSQLCGVDLRQRARALSFEHRSANLTLEPIPYADDSFGSVSAYDFLEHVPRVFPSADGRDTVFPFIGLMQEIWRVLAPGGRLYALTPAWPHPEAFVDPTHVNFITADTHNYFCGEQPMARMYGFGGRFEVIRVAWVERADAYSAIPGSSENHPPIKRFARRLRRLSRWLRGKRATASPGYLLWELEARK